MRTYKETLGIIKRAAQQWPPQQNQAYTDIVNGMNMTSGTAQPQAGSGTGMLGGAGGLLGGLALGAFLPSMMQGFKGINGQQMGRDAYQGVKQGIKDDLKAVGQGAVDAAKWAGDKVMSAMPGMAGTVYNAGKAIYNNWDTIKDTAGKTWQGVKDTYNNFQTQLNNENDPIFNLAMQNVNKPVTSQYGVKDPQTGVVKAPVDPVAKKKYMDDLNKQLQIAKQQGQGWQWLW